MSILQATQSASVLEAALSYLETGLSVIPVNGKRNAVRWSRFQTQRATPGLVHWWHNKGFLSGVAVVCGSVSNNLVIMDLDGEEAVEQYELTFPHLLDTLTIRSGSGKGKHYYYITSICTPTTRTNGFELRSDGCYVVAPPSPHVVTHMPYRVEVKHDPRRLDNLDDVRKWIVGKIRQKPRPQPSPQITKRTRYAAAVLRYECDNVRRAGEGSVNSTLYMAAVKLGNLVASGMLARTDVENQLFFTAAELTARDGEAATWRTIQSGIQTGLVKGKR